MKYFAILCWAILCYCNSSTAQTVPVTNIQEQIRNLNDAVVGESQNPTNLNDPSFYPFSQLSNTIQGVIIQLAPTEIKRIFLQSNNCRLQFVNINLVSILEANFDNSGWQTIHNGTPRLNIGWITLPTTFMTLGEHNLKVRFQPSAASNFLDREYRISVTAACTQLHIDNKQVLKNNGDPLI